MSAAEYVYVQRNLFDAPEFYDYAECKRPDYLDLWRSSREVSRLQAQQRASMPDENSAGQSSQHAHGIGLIDILHGLDGRGPLPPLSGASDTKDILDKLVTKYEIFRRLFTAYDTELRRMTGSSVAGLSEYVTFAETLAHFSEIHDSAKHLSTLLKIVDALCSAKIDDYTGALARRLASLIERERLLVEAWERQVRLGS